MASASPISSSSILPNINLSSTPFRPELLTPQYWSTIEPLELPRVAPPDSVPHLDFNQKAAQGLRLVLQHRLIPLGASSEARNKRIKTGLDKAEELCKILERAPQMERTQLLDAWQRAFPGTASSDAIAMILYQCLCQRLTN